MSDLKFIVDKLKSNIPLHQVVGEVVQLSQKTGRQTGLCPFHQEKTPSFYVFEDSYHCFGCGEHGDSIEFIKKTKNLSFIEAIEFLAEKYNVAIPELHDSKNVNEQAKKIKDFYKVFNLAQTIFVQNLFSDQGQIALEYLKKRGFTDETIKEFGFGLSLQNFDQLTRYLKRHQIDPQVGHEVELLRPSKKFPGESYDFFRERLMIPIHDKHGRIIAFGGRTLKNDPVKYVNSPNHPLFNKKNTLFGLDKAKSAIIEKNRIFIVEGYMDTLQLWKYGFRESVAVLGTALSQDHLKLIQGLTTHVYLIFDGDAAGIRASLRTVDLSLEFSNLQIKVISLPQKHDPDSYLKEIVQRL